MDARALKEFLEAVRAGKVSVDEAVRRIADLPVQHVADFAQLDGERALRQGVPEVVFGERKSPEQIGALVAKLGSLGQAVLVTRMQPEAEKAALEPHHLAARVAEISLAGQRAVEAIAEDRYIESGARTPTRSRALAST